MHIRALLPLAVILALALPSSAQNSITYEPTTKPQQTKHVVFLTGDEEYRSEQGLPMLAKILAQRHGFKCTVLFAIDPNRTINPENNKSLAGAEALDSADAIVMLIRWRAWPRDEMKHFADGYLRGVPIIALRTSTHPFKFAEGPYVSFNNFGKRVIGEEWVSHWGKHKAEGTRAVVEPTAKEDPILRGVGAIFCDTDVYEAHPPVDVKVLLRGEVVAGMKETDPPANYTKKRATDQREQNVNDPMMPIAWTRVFRNEAGNTNRIFCTTMGAATDLQNESLRRLIVNAVYWGMELEVPAKADVRYVGEYHPSPYGFGGYRKGIKPDEVDSKVQSHP